MNKTGKIISGIVILLIIAGGAFYGGMIYGKNQATSSRPAFAGNFAGRNNRTGGTAGAGFVSGNIIAKDATSITVQPATGGSKIIFYSDTTQINKFATGTSADLSSGTNVMVTGTTNSDGSITAQSIQIRPAK